MSDLDLRGGPPVRGILFDLWNTLAFTDMTPNPVSLLARAFGLDDRPGWRQRIERAVMTRRLPGIGEAIDAIAEAAGAPPSGRWTRRDLVLMWGEACNHNRLYPDVLPALRRLRGPRAAPGGGKLLRLGVLSNTQSFDLDFMQREGLLPLMDDVILSCDCGLLKPDPAIYALAAHRLGLAAGQILMVGDNPIDDVEGPRRAGMRARLLDRSGAAEGALRSLADLEAALTG